MELRAKSITVFVSVLVCCALSADGAFGEVFTVDDAYVKFSFDESIGSMTSLTWKQGSNKQLVDLYWTNVGHKAILKLGADVHNPSGYRESGAVVSDVQHGTNFYHATFTNATYGSKTVDVRWGAEGLYAMATFNLTRSDLFLGCSWEPGGNNSNDYVKIYPVSGSPFTMTVPYPGGYSDFYDNNILASGVADNAYNEMFGYRSDLDLRQRMGSGASMDGPHVYLPSGSSTLEFAVTSKTCFDAFAQGDWSIEAAAVPEPGTLLLLGTGVLGVMGWARRRR